MNNDNLVGFWGHNGAQWALNMDVTTGNLGIRSNPVSDRALNVNSGSRDYGIIVSQANSFSIYAMGDTYTTGRAIDNKIHSWVATTNRVDITSTGWIDMPNMSITITLPRNAHLLIMVQVNGVQMQGGTSLRGGFRILVDDAEVQRTHHEFNNNGWELRGVNMSELRLLAAGIHTIKVQWYISAGITLSCCWYNDKRQIQIIELS
jgi:hypothetical protein